MFHTAIAERVGLSATDSKAMGILEQLGPLTAGELARHAGLANASVTALIDRLEGKGFVRRVRDAGDRRRVMVELDRGRLAPLVELFASFEASLEGLVGRYSARELVLIIDFLEASAGVVREETAKLAAAGEPKSRPKRVRSSS